MFVFVRRWVSVRCVSHCCIFDQRSAQLWPESTISLHSRGKQDTGGGKDVWKEGWQHFPPLALSAYHSFSTLTLSLSPLSVSPSLSTLIRDHLDSHDTPELKQTHWVSHHTAGCVSDVFVCLSVLCLYTIQCKPSVGTGWGQSMSFSVSQFQEI
jgi:hypothetical protein